MFGSDAVGCQKSCAHTFKDSLCYSNTFLCQLGWGVGGPFVYKLSGILVSCHESTYDLLFCLQAAWVFFLLLIQMDVS